MRQCIIDWSKINDQKSLIKGLKAFLEEIFGVDLINKELDSMRKMPKYKPEDLYYIIEPNIHRAAKWYKLLKAMEERGYSFDLRFSVEVEEFMNLLAFTYSFNEILCKGVLDIRDNIVYGKIRDRDRFESLMYEIIVAANYVSNNFHVEFPDLGKSRIRGRMDIYAEKGATKVYAECKALRRENKYAVLAVNTVRKLQDEDLCALVDITLLRTPRTSKDVRDIMLLLDKAIEAGTISESGAKIEVRELPKYMRKSLEISVLKPRYIEYVLASSFVRFSQYGFEVKEPKIVIVKHVNKFKELKRRLKRRLHEAHGQLKDTKGRRVIYVDVSDVVGKPIIQLPELIKLSSGPDILLGELEGFIRSWLEKHPDIDAIALSLKKIYMDPFRIPYALVVEHKTVCSYIAPGWTSIMGIIPMPPNPRPEILVNLGVEAARRGLYTIALNYYKLAIKLKPELKEAYNNMGRLLSDLGRIDEALSYLDKALELDPNYVSAIINKGIALAKLGRYKEALEQFNKATNLNPANAKAWYNLALLCYILGRLDEAYKYVLKALAINPKYGHAQKLKTILERQLSI